METPIDILLEVTKEIVQRGMTQYTPNIYNVGQYAIMVSVLEFLNLNGYKMEYGEYAHMWRVMDGTRASLYRTFRDMGLKIRYMSRAGQGIYFEFEYPEINPYPNLTALLLDFKDSKGYDFSHANVLVDEKSLVFTPKPQPDYELRYFDNAELIKSYTNELIKFLRRKHIRFNYHRTNTHHTFVFAL